MPLTFLPVAWLPRLSCASSGQPRSRISPPDSRRGMLSWPLLPWADTSKTMANLDGSSSDVATRDCFMARISGTLLRPQEIRSIVRDATQRHRVHDSRSPSVCLSAPCFALELLTLPPDGRVAIVCGAGYRRVSHDRGELQPAPHLEHARASTSYVRFSNSAQSMPEVAARTHEAPPRPARTASRTMVRKSRQRPYEVSS